MKNDADGKIAVIPWKLPLVVRCPHRFVSCMDTSSEDVFDKQHPVTMLSHSRTWALSTTRRVVK